MADAVRGACWTQDRADAVLQTLALANQEPEFLAVHQPIRDFQVTSPSGSYFEPTDEALLATLSHRDTRNAFCVVEGEPGAGKSHLIRWLSVKWNREDLVILIERADGSLTGTLRQLREGLGPEHQHLFENLGASIEASFEGRVSQFQANLAVCLRPGFFEKPIGDEEWCANWEIGRIIAHPTMQEAWQGPERIMRIMAGDGGQRNSGSAAFNLYDIADLAAAQSALEGLPPRALMFLRALKRECDRIGPARAEGVSAESLELDEALDLPEARKLLKALNTRRNYAVQGILGISIDGLRTMFLNLRKELKKQERRLVLLLEDVTSWEGIDGQLIDAVSVDARARTDVCDMISVVGVTPLYLRDLQGNYGGRISYILRLGRRRQQGGFQETIQLSTAESQIEFASRYLRAVRIKAKDLTDWYEAGAQPEALPNVCGRCEVRDQCFAAFGEVGGVGLFPFNSNAITNAFAILEDPENKQSLQTPRGLIQGVLSPVLLHPARLDEGAFPPVEIEFSNWMPHGELQPSGFLGQVIAAAEPDPDRRNQLRRLAMLWGDRSSDVRVVEGADGVRTAAGVAEGVFEAFGLPWLGEGLGVATEPQPVPLPPQTPAPLGPAGEGPGLTPPTAGPGPPPAPLTSPQVGQAPGTRRSPTGTPSLTAARLKALTEQAQQWRDRKPLTDVTIWETPLAELMSEVQRLVPDPAPGVWERMFTRETVRLEGVGRADSRHFVIPRDDWATRGIEAFLQLRSGEALPPVQLEANRRAVARLLRRLAELAQAQVRRRLEQEEAAWSASAVAAQVLLARAWLRGAVSPSEPLWRQFEEILGSEVDARSAQDARVESWGELTRASNYYNDKLRGFLRQALQLPLGDGAPLMDAGAVAAAMADLVANLRGIALPTGKPAFSRGLEDIAKLVELGTATEAQLRYIPDRESRSLSAQRRRALALLRRKTLAHHIAKVDDALNAVASKLLQAGPVERDLYAKARLRLKEADLLDEGGRPWEALREHLLTAEVEDEAPAATLARVLEAPVASLAVTLDALEKAEAAIVSTYRYAKVYVETNQTEGDLSVVQAFGAALVEAAVQVEARLKEVV